MTTSDYDPESQAERRRVLVNDARVRATTMHQHAVAEASIVLVATTAMRRSVPARLEPGLNPNQPNARMNVPSITMGML